MKLLSKHSPELIAKVEKLLEGISDECKNFLIAYGNYVEAVDDDVDEEYSLERKQLITSLASQVFSSNYFLANRQALLMVELLNNITFFDTVKWEKSPELWKRQHARVLNHCAYNMLFAVIILEKGFAAASSISTEFRESAHLLHMNDSIEMKLS